MGLDISSVTKYETSETPRVNDEMMEFHNVNEFKEQMGELSELGYFDVIDYGESFSCGYGRYMAFREYLASLVYKPKLTPKPDYGDPDFMNKNHLHMRPHIAGMYESEPELEDDFVSLIHFSDCEGFICNKYCKLLTEQFEKHMDKSEGGEWHDKYVEFYKCVKSAADSGGFLWFH